MQIHCSLVITLLLLFSSFAAALLASVVVAAVDAACRWCCRECVAEFSKSLRTCQLVIINSFRLRPERAADTGASSIYFCLFVFRPLKLSLRCCCHCSASLNVIQCHGRVLCRHECDNTIFRLHFSVRITCANVAWPKLQFIVRRNIAQLQTREQSNWETNAMQQKQFIVSVICRSADDVWAMARRRESATGLSAYNRVEKINIFICAKQIIQTHCIHSNKQTPSVY